MDDKLINDFKELDTFAKKDLRFDEDDLISNYLDLLKKSLTGTVFLEENSYEFERIKEGLSWPLHAETMIGLKRLNNLHFCVTQVIKNNIPGDFIETGVWRGGATIFMKGALKAYRIKNRNVWVADSFAGLPPPNSELYPLDTGSDLYTKEPLRVSVEQVKKNFEKYHLYDEQVIFLKGWFKDTLPSAQIESLAVLRLDGDMYESTMDALVNLYPKLSKGGYIIIDDWGVIEACNRAVDDYRQKFGIKDPIIRIDHSGIYWQKS